MKLPCSHELHGAQLLLIWATGVAVVDGDICGGFCFDDVEHVGAKVVDGVADLLLSEDDGNDDGIGVWRHALLGSAVAGATCAPHAVLW